MAYDRKELVRTLKQNGFWIKRRTKHEQWWDGFTRITMPTGNGFDGRRMGRYIHNQIERAIQRRREISQGIIYYRYCGEK